MKPAYKLLSVIVLGIALFLIASWWEGSLSKSEGDFIELGRTTFHTSLPAGINESKDLNKPIFLYFRSETCYWCIVFEEESLSDESAIEILNKNFVLISIDQIRQKKAAANLNVWSTPYMIFFEGNGEEILRIPGYIKKEDFIVKLDEVMGKINV
ncbi:MAG: thioredoxin family protein [Candidatus Methanoperedens sp.]|nr:thioredoxin family protein [Candidatus Methanoperedens sp.]